MKTFILFFKRHGLILTVVLALIGLGLYFYIQEDVPETNNAFVIARVRPVSTRVEGIVDNIAVSNDQFVKKGQLLFSLDPQDYQIALENAKLNLSRGQTTLASLQLSLKQAEKVIEEKNLAYQTAQYNFNNAQKLFLKNDFPKAQLTQMDKLMQIKFAAFHAAKIKYAITQKDLLKAKLNIKQLELDVKKRQLQLDYTRVYALSDGFATNLNLAVGTYVKAGQPLFAFVNSTHWWVQANLKETELTHVKPGDKVRITIRMYPDHTFYGVIKNAGWAVQRQLTDPKTFLAEVINENQWFLLPQRFPVLIQLKDLDPKKFPLHVGASAYVKVITK